NKNMTTIEGGAISGGSPEELKAIELHRWHGQVKSGLDGFDTLLPGGKANLSDVAAAVGLGQLRRLEEFNARRRLLVARYFELWGTAGALGPPRGGALLRPMGNACAPAPVGAWRSRTQLARVHAASATAAACDHARTVHGGH